MDIDEPSTSKSHYAASGLAGPSMGDAQPGSSSAGGDSKGIMSQSMEVDEAAGERSLPAATVTVGGDAERGVGRGDEGSKAGGQGGTAMEVDQEPAVAVKRTVGGTEALANLAKSSIIYPPQLTGRPGPSISGSQDLFTLFNLRPMYDAYVRPYLPPQALPDVKGKGKADIDGAQGADGAVDTANGGPADAAGAGSNGDGKAKRRRIERYWTQYVADLPGPRQTRKPPQDPSRSLPHLLMNPDPPNPPPITPNPLPLFDADTLRAGWTLQPGVLEGFDPGTWVPDDNTQPQRRKKKKKKAADAATAPNGAAPSTSTAVPQVQPPSQPPTQPSSSRPSPRPQPPNSNTLSPAVARPRMTTAPPPLKQAQAPPRHQTAPPIEGSLKRSSNAVDGSGGTDSPEHRKKKKRKKEAENGTGGMAGIVRA